MNPKIAEGEKLKAEIARLEARQELILEVLKDHQSSVFSLTAQEASDEIVEEHRNKATFYYESYLDISILIARLASKLVALAK